jgi:glycosyltransferase involved in cell wall biosynthesis
MLVKDEADVIGHTLNHLLTQVDHVIVSDNLSTDDSRDIVSTVGGENPGRVTMLVDDDVAYYQSIKTSSLALRAFHMGHDWVIPCDADEVWYSNDGRAIRDYLAGVAPDVRVIQAALFNHLPTLDDDVTIENPLKRIQWRQRERAPLWKVCARTGPGLFIDMGNHSAQFEGTGLTVQGAIEIRHFSWRSADQYLRKIRNGEAAYAATNLGEEFGAHWRMFKDVDDDAVRDHFLRWFLIDDPVADGLVLDPAPTGTL